MAILDPDSQYGFKLDERDVEVSASRGSGPGGQHKNKTESCVTVTHRPSNVSVRIDMRSQAESKLLALKILTAKLSEQQESEQSRSRNVLRRDQLGSGMRSDKRRTYRERDNQVLDHVTGQVWELSKWLRGDW